MRYQLMFKSLVLWALLIFTFNISLTAQSLRASNKPQKPKLVVGLVIDQMRYDYLYKYAARYGKGGFNRLLANGFNCHNTFLNYIPTVTGCGHASIYTGSVPALNGIASNDWYDKRLGKMMYCVQDDSVKGLGTTLRSGKMSPKNLLATTIGDELKLSNNGQSKVVGISLKDRGAILPAGASADFAFWMDDTLGHFISSNWYGSSLPEWVNQFNAQNKVKNYLAQNWNTLYPINTYSLSTSDNNAYEGNYKNQKSPTFPHALSEFTKAADIKRTPYGNSISIDFAIETIRQMQLGKGAATDMLALSLSSPDYIGHQFGINSIEIEDCYYRLDKEIERLLMALDAQVGVGNYTLFLSADHGAAHNPIFLKDRKIAAGFFTPTAFKKMLNEKARPIFGSGIIADIGDNQVWINDSAADKSKAMQFVLDELALQKGMSFMGSFDQLGTAIIPATVKEQIINGYRPGRSGDIYFILDPAWQDAYGTSTTGTTHGTWNPHDAHIPLVFFGAGIKKGQSFDKVNVTDIAATLSSLLRIQMPNACIGKCVDGVLP
jgi:predicted AlkP superfamily pyrophosphatase or phosphodiesterase